ncbi:MAG: serine--tRNA ligase [Elusimicrobia bacterium HGW-Elusimicrobia-1]|jgi:seryl-tRNA synthetase|nr:MAG: serine--tRNA ligase [Elusimicrobia bacterium HGW-Elusimicrobia-1]
MLDIKQIRDNTAKIRAALGRRGGNFYLDELLTHDASRRQLIGDIETLRRLRNELSQKICRIQKEGLDAAQLKSEVEESKTELKEKEQFLISVEQKIEDAVLRIPNIPDESTPDGADASANPVVREAGDRKSPGDSVKPHWEVGEALGILDFAAAAKISGSRFTVLKNRGAALERAIISFMLDLHISRGYTEIMAPYLVNRKTMQGTGQLPKFESEVFRCSDDDLYLIPTAEVSVTNIHREEIIPEQELPKKYASYSACFRREAGSHGQDTRGLIRNHQFNKIELIKFAAPWTSDAEHETLLADAEEVLKVLNIPYRVVLLCAGDLGFAAAKTYDIEVWMPGEKRWREISSVSNFRDFQARRMKIKYRPKPANGKIEKPGLLHTLNASGLAVGRTFAAILENYQNPDGTLTVPECLRKYTGFDKIG